MSSAAILAIGLLAVVELLADVRTRVVTPADHDRIEALHSQEL